MRFKGKKALVTGAAGGIGKSIVRKLRAEGASVAVTDINITNVEAEAHFLGDLSTAQFCDELPSKARDALGGLDILINNAGIMREGNAEETNEADWFEQLQINLTTPFLLIKYALPLLKVSKGSIINVGSIEGLGSNPRHPGYCASKGGLHALTRAVAVDHGPEGVRCNAVAPGWINTELNEEFIKSLSDPKTFKNPCLRNVWGGLGSRLKQSML